MGLFQKIFRHQPESKSKKFVQSLNFKGFRKYKITNYGFPEAQENIKKIIALNPKKDFSGFIIRLDLILCIDKTDALAVFLNDLRIGTIFFKTPYVELLQAFKNNKVSAAYVGTNETDDFYLYVKLEV